MEAEEARDGLMAAETGEQQLIRAQRRGKRDETTFLSVWHMLQLLLAELTSLKFVILNAITSRLKTGLKWAWRRSHTRIFEISWSFFPGWLNWWPFSSRLSSCRPNDPEPGRRSGLDGNGIIAGLGSSNSSSNIRAGNKLPFFGLW